MEENKSLEIISKIKAGKIEHNYGELRERVALMVEPYKGLVFTQETIQDAKKTVAQLQRFYDDLDNERKNLKKSWMEPYLKAEDLMKKVLGEIDGPIKDIRVQLSEFDKQEKADKREAIMELKAKLLENSPIADLIYTIPWFNEPRWENKTITLKKIETEIIALDKSIQNDLRAIQSASGEYTDQVIQEYIRCGSLPDALRAKDRMIAEKERAEKASAAMKAQQEAEQQKREMRAAEEAKAAPQTHEEQKLEKVEEPKPIKTIRFSITADIDGFKSLFQFCKENNIKMEVIK